ncbi:VWA domain-containing protein [Parenemella sanctibonifatiensis]|uniref:VWA domain-containing protein n=1 Tax=Parenemella sanctibonifatiensis TaxID=2016505 RepID=A0A255ERU9_9ACTN|nr:VWA domain-containing protein [Parenemella sanctibonifatiensis]OYN92315.1 hypothetical protein CGZ91_02065 [Parenemella sanctibonifatiensis]
MTDPTDTNPTDPLDPERLRRWRLVLGAGSEALGDLDAASADQDRALTFLYDRETNAGQRSAPGAHRRGAGRGPSTMTVPEWINTLHELFPAAVVETLEADALDRYGLTDVVTTLEALERVQPSEHLLAAILQTKHLMNADVLAAARTIVRKVVADLLERLRPEIRQSILGKRDPQRRSHHHVAANFDPHRTIRANLKHLDPATGKLIIAEPIFAARTRRESQKWQTIMVVDQSGSMASSVIHSAVTAAIFHGIGALRSHLVVFDTDVVDLSADVADPVELLMQVQLGGGTDIARAMAYAETLVSEPRRAIVCLITDLYEGGSAWFGDGTPRGADLAEALVGAALRTTPRTGRGCRRTSLPASRTAPGSSGTSSTGKLLSEGWG